MVKNLSTNSSAFDLNARRLSDAEEMDMRETSTPTVVYSLFNEDHKE